MPQRSLRTWWGALLAALAMIFAGLGPAQALAMSPNGFGIDGGKYGAGRFINPVSLIGLHEVNLGVQWISFADGLPVYCIEMGQWGGKETTWAPATDKDSQIAAVMVNQNLRHINDDFIQSAVAYAIHDHLDPDLANNWSWLKANNNGLEDGDWNATANKAAELWQAASNAVPAKADIQQAYTSGKRTGSVDPGILNAAGKRIAGLAYTVTLKGPARFNDTKDGAQTYKGTTTGGAQSIVWTATGNGDVTATVSYATPTGGKQIIDGYQNTFKPLQTTSTQNGYVSFRVQSDFQPTVTTNVSTREVHPGDRITDTVTSGVKQGDSWADGVHVLAHGYYFTGDETLLSPIPQDDGKGHTNDIDNPESPVDYLHRLIGAYGEPVGEATVTFTKPGETKTVTAQAGGKDYISPENGTFGSWYWTISKTEQPEETRDYITHSYNDLLGKINETSSHPSSIVHDSTVLEQASGLDTDIMDTITIAGLPADYGDFAGNDEYGMSADANATIRVWWAGSGTGNREQDMQYEPDSPKEPKQDEHHKLLGEWEVPARNGTYKVGGGAITLLEQGTKQAKTVAKDVAIRASDAKETGYYVFIYDFPGSSRATAFRSDYNDPWERSFIEQTASPVSLTSHVSHEEVGQGDQFYDVAHVTGRVERGSYVLFTAYDAVHGDPDLAAPTLLREVRVDVTDKQADESGERAFDVLSPKTSTDTVGNVYWKAQLFAPDGKALASHEFGIESETVKVRGISVTSKTSAEQVYVNQEFSDTATIHGKVSRGTFVIFEAYDPVDGGPETTTTKLLENAKVPVTDQQADSSDWNTTFDVVSPTVKATRAGRVYWHVRVMRADGHPLASHELGAAGEDVLVLHPSITTNVSRTAVKPNEEFYDTARITGSVERGSYVTFDAYAPVTAGPETVDAKLLDAIRVPISDRQADASASEPVVVRSPATKTAHAGTVYWRATLHMADGTAVATHDLGLPEETTYVAPGGYVSSEAQPMGGAGEPLYDMVTVYHESEGHEGNGNANPSGMVGSIPQGSYVTVELYRQDGHNTASKANRIASHDFPVDVAAMREGKLTFKAAHESFHLDSAGVVYWVATLKTANGAVLDKAVYGESGDQHGTGVESRERTPVQEYSTTIAKQWFSVNNTQYAEQTVRVYDVLKQTAWRQQEGDAGVIVAQTAPGTQYLFEVWKQGAGDVATDTLMFSGDAHAMPQSRLAPQGENADAIWQQMKSETFTIGADWGAGTYYVRVLVTHPDVDRSVEGRDHVVAYTPARDKSESFRVVSLASQSVEPLVSTDNQYVQDSLRVEGTLPKGSSYEAQLWTTDADGNCVKPVGQTTRVTLEEDVTNTTLTLPVMATPQQAGAYQWRFRVWTPDELGGEPTIEDASVRVPDDWKQGDGYASHHLVYDGTNVPAEHMEIVRISTNVAGTSGVHTDADGRHYVNVTHGASVQDRAVIEGNLADGYTLGFDLYRQDAGEDADADQLIKSIEPVALASATTELESQIRELTEPGTYYWVTRFAKADGSAWLPDNAPYVLSPKRVVEETFEAARITTVTNAWSGAGGTTVDTARIEGCVPQDATANFELHDYDTGDLIGETGQVTLGELGYESCSHGSNVQTVTSPAVSVPEAKDYYFVESLRLPNEPEDEFHRGNDRVPYESTRAIAASTRTATQVAAGTAVSDYTDLKNLVYDGDPQLRDDLAGPLTIAWEVWRQGTGDESTDTKLAVLDALELEDGATEANSPAYLFKEMGVYYFRARVCSPNGDTVAYGEAREPAETVRVVEAESSTDPVVEERTEIRDTVTIRGPVLAGTMVSWNVYALGNGEAADDQEVASWTDADHGAYMLTQADAATAMHDGEVSITSPLSYRGKAGQRVYFVFSLTAPARGEDGTVNTGRLASAEDLALTNIQTGETTAAFFTDAARVTNETVSIIRITTQVSRSKATVGDVLHDTALITGHVPQGHCVTFEYWRQDDGDDVAEDKLETATACVTVPEGATHVNSPDVVAGTAGTFYFRERLEHATSHKRITYGEPRVSGETVQVKKPKLAKTGIALMPFAMGGAGLLLCAAGLLTLRKRWR